MTQLPGFQLSKVISKSSNTLIFRGERESDKTPVIVKILNKESPSLHQLAQFRREHDISLQFQSEEIVKTYGLEKYKDSLAIILEDFGGESLESAIENDEFSLVEKIQVAIKMSIAVGKVHQQNIIHKNIKPSNFVWNRYTDTLKLIDFGISSKLSRESPEIDHINHVEGTLDYVSPEQTGRMNRSMDYRTDLYSLGVTLYQLLTGTLPFKAEDAIGIIHCHIAIQPTPPTAINSEIPQDVSDIVMKLLSKMAENRYQNIAALTNDLTYCMDSLAANGRIENFVLGKSDISDRFHISQKLYGREKEIDALLAAFDRTVGGSKEIMLVAGYSGIGKSALINEVIKPITEKRGNFISGKYDQYKRNIPYSALIQAFQRLVKRLLCEDKETLDEWKDKIQNAVGPSGQVVVDVIPHVELIIGKQPPINVLEPDQARNRFNIVFRNFIRVFSQEDHPLVIFVDDLQWADLPSLQLIEQFMTDPETRYMLIIGAYRDNEVDDTHPMTLSINELRKMGFTCNSTVLKPLVCSDVNALISESLCLHEDETLPVATLCAEKTLGNPFFLNQLLHYLYDEGAIDFSRDAGAWTFDIGKIKHAKVTENVVELMVDKIKKLPNNSQHLLKLASSIGNQFDLATLSVVSKQPPHLIAPILFESLKENLIIPSDDGYKYISDSDTKIGAGYRFLHDRIQQAAYSLVKEEDKKALHLTIGRLLLQSCPDEEREEQIFDIVNHLNQGLPLIVAEEERDIVSELNLVAGRRAKSSSAYKPALDHFRIGIELVGAAAWENKYELLLSLYEEAEEAAYLCGDYTESERLFDEIRGNAKDILDTVKAYEIRTITYTSQGMYKEAMETGLEALKLLGIKLPNNPQMIHLLFGLLKIKLKLKGKSNEDLLALGVMTDPKALAMGRIALKIGTAAYFSKPLLYPLTVFIRLRLSIKYGADPLSSFSSYAALGLILCSIGKIEEGYRFGLLAERMLDESDNKKDETRIKMLMNNFILHWKEHLGNTLKPLVVGYESKISTGDVEFASHAAFAYCCNSYLRGVNLKQLKDEQAAFIKATSTLNQKFDFDTINLFYQARESLVNPIGLTTKFIAEGYDEALMVQTFLNEENKSSLFCFHLLKLNISYLLHDYEQAKGHLDQSLLYVDSVKATFLVPYFNFYESLTLLALCDGDRVKSGLKRKYLKVVKKNQKKLSLWAEHAPMNCLHKWNLVEAERCRVLKKDTFVEEYYEKAIELSRANEYVQEEALAFERYAVYLRSTSDSTKTIFNFQKARYCYLRWGADAKAKQLKDTYKEVSQRGS